MLYLLSMPSSSKKELIRNFKKNKDKIFVLKKEYSKLVPDSYNVYIEFNPKNILIDTNESVDIRIFNSTDEDSDVIVQEWNLEYNSENLNNILKILNWDYDTLASIKGFLESANCISIENGKRITNVGFARSGMGKYSYDIFEKKLDENIKTQYNDGCNYIYYKDHIVLEYGGGAIGSQCFPD